MTHQQTASKNKNMIWFSFQVIFQIQFTGESNKYTKAKDDAGIAADKGPRHLWKSLGGNDKVQYLKGMFKNVF